jgi:hypothetical protein
MSVKGQKHQTLWTDSNGKSWDLALTVADVGERKELVSIRISATSKNSTLTQSIIREVPILKMLQNLATEGSLQLPARISGRWTPSQRLSIRHNRDYVLKEVARTYQNAYKAHLPVQKTVAQRLNVPLSTATRYIAIARKFGYLTDIPRQRPTSLSGSRRRNEHKETRIQD